MRDIKLFFLLPLLAPVSCLADGLEWGLYVKAGAYSVEDPDGKTKSQQDFLPGFKLTYPFLGRNSRVAVGAELIDFELDTDGKEVSQDVAGYRLFGAYEHGFPVSRNVKLWAGAGITLNDVSYENRYTVDQDGYLDNLYENRSEASMGSAFYINALFGRGSFVPGIGLFVDLPFGDGVKAFGGTFSINFD